MYLFSLKKIYIRYRYKIGVFVTFVIFSVFLSDAFSASVQSLLPQHHEFSTLKTKCGNVDKLCL